MKFLNILIISVFFSPITLATEIESADESADKITIELNRLEQKDQNCITYFMIKNSTNMSFNEFKTELVTFNKSGLINNRILGDFKKIRPNKTVVKLFAMPDTKCDAVDKILINDVHDCTHGKDGELDCLDLLEPEFKGDVELFK